MALFFLGGIIMNELLIYEVSTKYTDFLSKYEKDIVISRN